MGTDRGKGVELYHDARCIAFNVSTKCDFYRPCPGRRFYPYPKDTPDRCTSPRQAWPLGQAALSLATRPPPFLEASRGGGYEGDDKKLACGRFMDLDH